MFVKRSPVSPFAIDPSAGRVSVFQQVNHSDRIRRVLYGCVVLLMLPACSGNPLPEASKAAVYKVLACAAPPVIDADWNKEFWDQTASIVLANHMGDDPDHFPVTRVKMRYDQDSLYLIFRVADRHVRAVATVTHGKVWQDSCVEFFFSPGTASNNGYFNFETNCKGVFLFQFHDLKSHATRLVESADCAKIAIAHSLKANAQEEIQTPVVWTLEYSIPLAILGKYMEVENPRKGTRWRANFYKCADASSHPHWLTWAKVAAPIPNFHLPEFFGWLEFE